MSGEGRRRAALDCPLHVTPARGKRFHGLRLAVSVLLGMAIAAGLGGEALSSLPCLVERQPTALQSPNAENSAQPAPDSPPADYSGLQFEELQPLIVSASWRFGIGVPGGAEDAKWVSRLGAGWWYSWSVKPANELADDIEFWQMIRLRGGKLTPTVEQFAAEARRRPGQVWIVGNEPDVISQDNVSPVCFAYLYHEVYVELKRADPTARVAPGGITQASPLRLEYLDNTLAEYRRLYNAKLPADFWTMHAFALREQRGQWGVGIPPGLAENAGWLLTIGEHDDIGLFHSQILGFRRWMAAQGYRDRPLVITEYGILMPGKYGFDTERVRRFMLATFEFLMTARDLELGLPSDDNRLVQRWAWFSLADPIYPTGNLIVPGAERLTLLGMTYREFVAAGR